MTERTRARELARIARCMLISRADGEHPADVAGRLYGDEARVTRVLKSATDTHGTSGTGGELYSPAVVAAEFADAVRPLTVLGRLATVRVPFATPLPFISTRSTFDFVQERAPIPATNPGFGGPVHLRPKKVAGIIAVSKELVKSSRAEEVLQSEMTAGVVEAMDRRLLDPTSTVTDGRPASVTSAASAFDGTGVDTPAEIDDLLSAMIGTLITAGSTLVSAAFVTTPQNCASLALMRTTNGDRAYPGVTVTGGAIAGLPLLASASAPANGLALVDGSEILVADDGETSIVVTDQAMIRASDDPANEATWLSVFEADCLALKVVRTVNWELRRSFVAYATNFSLPAATASTA